MARSFLILTTIIGILTTTIDAAAVDKAVLASASASASAANDDQSPPSHRDYEIPEESIIELPFGRFPEPQCDYSVHAGDSDGPAVTGARIGDPLYHRWSCDTADANSRMFCILVNNCTVSNNKVRHQIIDADGCTLEPQILPDVSYENDLVGGIQCNAFSLGFNEPTISFNCGIKLLLKDDAGICHRPSCNKQTTPA